MICRPINGHTPRKLPAVGGNLSFHRTSSPTIIHENRKFCNSFRKISFTAFSKKINPIFIAFMVIMHKSRK